MIELKQEDIIEMANRIKDWESNAGEGFTDYFMHDNVRDVSWAFWLLGKGFVERANEILNQINSGEKCLDQELLYEVYEVHDWTKKSQEAYYKNILLWAEFLISTQIYKDRVEEFFNKLS